MIRERFRGLIGVLWKLSITFCMRYSLIKSKICITDWKLLYNKYMCLFQTFCVVSKRFRKNYIHRFTATSSFFWWSPWSPMRRACIYLCTNQLFDYVVMATILLNCVFLAMTETVEEAEWVIFLFVKITINYKSKKATF